MRVLLVVAFLALVALALGVSKTYTPISNTFANPARGYFRSNYLHTSKCTVEKHNGQCGDYSKYGSICASVCFIVFPSPSALLDPRLPL